MSNVGQSFQAGKAHAEGQCQAERAAQSVKDAAGAATDSAQQQQQRAAGVVQQTGEQVAQMAQSATTAVKNAVSGGSTTGSQ